MQALLTKPTVREAAHVCGVPEQTIYKWLKKPAFKEEYEEQKKRIVEDSANYLQIKLNEATATVLELMHDQEAPSQVRLNAARTVFEYCYKFIEQREVIGRIDALEQALSEEEQ